MLYPPPIVWKGSGGHFARHISMWLTFEGSMCSRSVHHLAIGLYLNGLHEPLFFDCKNNKIVVHKIEKKLFLFFRIFAALMRNGFRTMSYLTFVRNDYS